jgi:putative nucleotidyltransferase with HDIG domain
LDVTKAFRSIIHIDVLLETIAEVAAGTVGAEGCSILLFDEDGQLRFTVARGAGGSAVKPLVVKPGEGIAGWTAREGKPALVNDVRHDPRWVVRFDEASGFETRSVLAVPLVFEGRVTGVIELINKLQGRDFDDQDQNILFSLADQAAISIEHARLRDAQNNYFAHVIEILVGAMDTHVPVKAGHARRVARYAHLVGRQMGLDEQSLKTLYFAALLHDIGFLKIDSLAGETRESIELHPELGFEMVQNIILWRELAPLIKHHHERWDGRGYPDRLSGAAIPLGARIIAACDALDIITSSTSYKARLPFDMALRELDAHAKTQFDADILLALKAAIKESDTLEKKSVPPAS